MKRKLFDSVVFLSLFGIGILLIINQSAVSDAVVAAIKNCVYTIIPSLFGMSVISTAISKSGIFSRFLRNGKINAAAFTAFVFGNIGGYPIGAKLISESLDDGSMSVKEAESAMAYSFGCGPAFAAGVAGAKVFGSTLYGIAAFLAVACANLTVFILSAFMSKSICKGNIHYKPEGFSTKLMLDSVSSATSAMLGISSTIVFFSALRAALEAIMPSLVKLKYFSTILEISNISSLSTNGGVRLWQAAVFLGFGGLCVQMQLAAIINGRFSLRKFYFSRLIVLPLAALYSELFSILLEKFGVLPTAAFGVKLSESGSLMPFLCVAAMVFIAFRGKGKRAG